MKKAKDRYSSPSPILTSSVLADLPKLLREILIDASAEADSILVSSNRLANRFVFERWGIRPSQRKRYKELFSDLTRHCRILFQYLLKQGRIEWEAESEWHSFNAFKYDLIRGNLILNFTNTSKKLNWLIRRRAS
ncbi:MAG: hypothetical protein ACFFAY_08455 [Promethearchaeota archaeon]